MRLVGGGSLSPKSTGIERLERWRREGKGAREGSKEGERVSFFISISYSLF